MSKVTVWLVFATSTHPTTGWETSARPLANASENLAGRVENRPGQVEFCIGFKRLPSSGECQKILVSQPATMVTQKVMVMNDQLTSLSFHVNQASHSWYTKAYFKIWPWNLKVKIMGMVKGQNHTSQVAALSVIGYCEAYSASCIDNTSVRNR